MAALSKKHFEAFALAMRHAAPDAGAAPDVLACWDRTRRLVADVLAAEGPNFDRGRFLAACNPFAVEPDRDD